MKKLLFTLGLIVCSLTVRSQTSDNNFSLSLSEVITEINSRYGITLRDPDHLAEGKTVTYALWRFQPDVDATLHDILHTVDLYPQKQNDSTYKIKKFRYHRLTIEQAAEKLEYLASLSPDKESWELRADELRSCVRNTLGIDKLRDYDSPVTLYPKRKYKGYTVENIALETLPGVYVCGSVYKPSKIKGQIPVVLCPNGHFGQGRYREDQQKRCAALARMGAVAISYDLFAWGESLLQFNGSAHRHSVAMRMQYLNGIKLLDYACSLPYTDTNRIAVTGGSGGGSQTMILSAIDPRINVSVPVVMLSANHYGGCPCESGIPVHLCVGGTNNPEIAATFAPKPQLIISDGGDWTSHVPEMEFPFMQRIYSFYRTDNQLENVHLPKEGHNYGINKRIAMYDFMAKHLELNNRKIQNKQGDYDESFVSIESENELKAFGENGELIPANALKGVEALEQMIKEKLQ